MWNIWQECWDIADTGRHLYRIQEYVGLNRVQGSYSKEEMFTQLRIGHTGLNHILQRIGKHPAGL